MRRATSVGLVSTGTTGSAVNWLSLAPCCRPCKSPSRGVQRISHGIFRDLLDECTHPAKADEQPARERNRTELRAEPAVGFLEPPIRIYSPQKAVIVADGVFFRHGFIRIV